MENPTNKGSKLKDFLTKPLVRSDSKTFQYSGLGIQLAATIIVFFFLGYWLDGVFGFNYLLTLIFAGIGFTAGFYSFFMHVKQLGDMEKLEKQKRKAEANSRSYS